VISCHHDARRSEARAHQANEEHVQHKASAGFGSPRRIYHIQAYFHSKSNRHKKHKLCIMPLCERHYPNSSSLQYGGACPPYPSHFSSLSSTSTPDAFEQGSPVDTRQSSTIPILINLQLQLPLSQSLDSRKASCLLTADPQSRFLETRGAHPRTSDSIFHPHRP
jgi:hypothetical protein